MKYIKTFDGIYETEKLGPVAEVMELTKLNDDLIAKADTIEELLDEYVIVAKDEENPFIYDLNVPVDNPEFDSKDETVYGMIWAKDEKGHPHLKPAAVLKGNKWEILNEYE